MITLRRALMLCTLAIAFCEAMAQEMASGIVLDAETKEPLIGAVIATADGEKTVSDLNGEFKINVKRGERVSISYVGYENKQLRIDDTQQRTVVNLDKGLTLKEVNVVASIASARSKKAVGADVAHLDATKLLDKGQASNLSDLLDGRVSGMQMFQSNGKVGMPIRFNMRSGATLSMDRDPIIYIDGVRYNNSHTSDINTSQDALSALNDLPMDDIASIDIIKGPAAAASYGAEAANGVIVITTKRQSAHNVERGKLSASAKITVGWSTKAREYTQFVNNTDINNFFVTGHNTSAYASFTKNFSPGNQLFFSLNENHVGGIVPGNKDVRHSLRAAYDMKQGPFTLNFSVGYINGNISIPQTAQGRNDAIWNLMRAQKPWGYVSERTWRAMKWKYDNDRLTAALRMAYILPYDIKLETQLGLDLNHIEGLYSLPYGYLLGTNDEGAKDISNRRNQNITWDWKASRQFELNPKLHLTATLLSQIVQRRETMNKVSASIFPADIDNIAAAAQRSVLESSFEQRTWGLYGEAFLNYDNRLFINAGLRRDASNLIGRNVASIYYPSLSMAYNVGNAKFRTAYGESGRLPYPTDAFTYYEMKGMSAYGPLLVPGKKGNDNIRPERMREIEAGLDWAPARHQIGLTAYAQFTSDAIIYTPLLSSNGWVGDEPHNVGRVNGWGVELSWNWKAWQNATRTADLNVFLTANYQGNRVINTGGVDIENLPNVLKEGQPAYAFYYKEVTGARYDASGKYLGAKESDEYHYLGKPFPDFNGAFGFDLRLLSNLTLSAKFNWAVGASVYNQSFYNVAGLGDNLKKREDLRAQLAAETVGTDAYRAVAEKLARTERSRANYIEKADFLRLSSISLGYDASSWAKRLTSGFVKGARLLFTAQNLFLITNYSGIEPQVESNGGTRQTRGMGSLSRDITNAPSARTFTGTLAIEF
ncbi:TonB-dependent receptor domain-containing protein [Hoylesella loescheii]|uniref:TonB-dependent receptor n=2 Tax=Hoylesella loescheii TaxID=840 RepID=A0A069QF47_HOYLO|nr:TonB-dependent receptor [Hoylesella loescheii]KDR51425.1 TonB-dependent receptor [Hoylesella loescheii DSM 19665 = JCM 12249 = ATCC 15930]